MTGEKTEKKQEPAESEESVELFKEIVDKVAKDGATKRGTYFIEGRSFKGHKFIQITQHKYGFGQQAGKTSIVTFDAKNAASIMGSIDKALVALE